MKKLATVVCTIILVSMMVSCGGQSATTNNEPKTSTTKTENFVNTKKTEQVVDVKTTKPAETPKIDEKKEQVLIELMTIRNLCYDFDRFNQRKDDPWNFKIDSGIPDYVNNSKILSKEIKNKLLKSLDDDGGESKFRAIVDVEIEKHKLP